MSPAKNQSSKRAVRSTQCFMKVLTASLIRICMSTQSLPATAFRAVPFLQKALGYHRYLYSNSIMRTGAGSAKETSSIEIEEKFAVPQDIEDRLMRWGFEKQQRAEMTDWYFDTPSLELLQQNVWLRSRQPENIGDSDQSNDEDLGKQGNDRWQIKVGQQNSNPHEVLATPATTVYVELEGLSALEKAASYLQSSEDPDRKIAHNCFLEDNASLFTNQTIPKVTALPQHDALVTQLVPLARIFTRRTSWTNTELNITVDLDETDFGHAVGEVEMVVHDETDVDSARTKVRQWASEFQDPCSKVESPIAMGKLEYYLFHYRPQVYSICVQSCVLG